MKGNDPSAGDTVLACPECDSSSVKTNAASDPRGPRGANKHRCDACGHTFDDQDAVRRPHKNRPLPRGDSLARQLLDADPDDLATDGGYGNHYNVDGEQPSPSPEDEDDVVLERRTTIQRHDDGGLFIPDGGSTQEEWVPGTCDICGHTREYTRTEDGQVICILCEDGITDAAQKDEELVTDGGSVQPDKDETGARSVDGKARSGATMQSSFLGPIEKIRRVFERLEGEDFDLVRIDLSGGKDSFVAAEAVRRLGPEYGLELDMVAHYNTGTGIPSTTELVQEYCAERGLLYVEGMNKKPKEMVGPQALDYGYYGAGEGRVMADRKHATAYVLRKQRVEDGLYRGFEGDILQFSGAYHDESDSRGGKMDGAIKWGETGMKKPRLTIASPIYALTEGEVESLAGRWDVPKAPAYATLDASGDCTGCAYDQAGRFGNLWAEAPHLAFAHATLMVWIQTRRARGELNLPPERVFFGWGALDEETVEALREEDEFYDPDEEIGPTAPEYAVTYDEVNEDDETEPPVLDPEQKRFTCSDCDDRCEPAIPVTVADGGTPEPQDTETAQDGDRDE